MKNLKYNYFKFKMQLKYNLKKRYKFLASFSILSHIFGVISVLYMLMFDNELWISSMYNSRFLIGLKEHNHDPYVILKIWMIGIQIRYIIVDCWVFYNSFKDGNLLKYTIKIHGLDGIICSSVFFIHNSYDCFIFGVICLIWTLMWVIAYFLLAKNRQIKSRNYLRHF